VSERTDQQFHDNTPTSPTTRYEIAERRALDRQAISTRHACSELTTPIVHNLYQATVQNLPKQSC
jgi:hypothetical protein